MLMFIPIICTGHPQPSAWGNTGMESANLNLAFNLGIPETADQHSDKALIAPPEQQTTTIAEVHFSSETTDIISVNHPAVSASMLPDTA